MDDNRFDDIIKGKVGEFEDTSFDPSALAALHNRMATDGDWPWHVRFRTEIIAGTAAAIVILLTLWGQWYFSELRTEELQDELLALKTQNEKMDGLIGEMKNFKSTGAPADTIRIIEIRERDPFLYARLVQQIEALKASLSDSFRRVSNASIKENYVLPVNNREAFTGVFENQFSQYRIRSFALLTVDSSTQESEPVNPEPKKLSAKEIIKKENYRKGVGFRLGPTAEVSQGLYPAGDGELNVGYGILGDFILSPSLSFETGLKYAHRFYSVGEKELNKINLPFVNQTIGDVKLAEIDSWVLEVPLHLKYRFPLSMKTSLLTRIGYSAMIYTGQTLEYSYEYDASNNLFVKDSHKQKGFHLYPGALNLSIGVSRLLKNKKILETGIFYQQGLGGMGVEKNKPSYLGIRGVYWIPLR